MIELQSVTRVFSEGGREVAAVQAVDLVVAPGERVVIFGRSGSGKSTLLHLAAGLDRATAGAVRFDGIDLAALPEVERARIRRLSVGFVFQSFNLLPALTAAENVVLPLDLEGVPRAQARDRALELLAEVGMSGRADHYPEQLSGGEMQRVAVARALVAEPRLIVADEPTGNLDSRTGAEILDLLAAAGSGSRALLMATHDPAARRIATRLLEMTDGRLRDRSEPE